MDNYKILNTKTNAIIKLLNELGYAWVPTTNDSEASLLKAHWIIAESSGDIAYSSTETFYEQASYKELSFNQLNDLVVLKRNDKADGNYKHRDGSIYYITSDNEFYLFDGRAWLKSLIETSEHLIEIEKPQPQEPALISGADALRALADGVKPEEIEGKYSTGLETYFLPMDGKVDVFLKYLNEKMFRLKPQTIKLELELPKPFEPKVGDLYWCIAMTNLRGYTQKVYKDDGDDECLIHLGAYRTEEEIKQVVEQLRKIRGAS
ncbi:hypothetical protein ACK13T_01670 [Acinetobacter baumannii]|uniref:hypothetical protein n=1 Tax=Acinetobacter baumannii TaxID=470 RepID=UPI00390C2D4C